jgi:hypothetical protein
MLKNSLNGVSLMLNERTNVLASIQSNCSDLLAHKNYSVFLSTTLYFVEWLKSNLPLTFNTSLKNGLKKTENRLYNQISILFFVRDLKISDSYFPAMDFSFIDFDEVDFDEV